MGLSTLAHRASWIEGTGATDKAWRPRRRCPTRGRAPHTVRHIIALFIWCPSAPGYEQNIALFYDGDRPATPLSYVVDHYAEVVVSMRGRSAALCVDPAELPGRKP